MQNNQNQEYSDLKRYVSTIASGIGVSEGAVRQSLRRLTPDNHTQRDSAARVLLFLSIVWAREPKTNFVVETSLAESEFADDFLKDIGVW